jgi:DNA-binding NtrC family response regulator
MAKILVVDDEALMRDSVGEAMRRSGHEVVTAASGSEAVERAAAESFHLVITDLRLPGVDGVGVLAAVKREMPETPVILVTAHGTVENAVEAMKKGAYDYIEKPFKLEELELLVRRALEHRTLSVENEYLRTRVGEAERHDYVWISPKMKALRATLERVAASDANVLILGETGTGKEVAARAIHQASPRQTGPFLCVNCAALSAGLLESELFGHEKGAFTGAESARKGRFELADNGTLLLDEVSEIDLNLQAKLLRVLQERTFERVGSSIPRRVDVRVLATSNRDLQRVVREGRFREDLFYRLNVVPVQIPPLRERPEDIPPLVEHFLKRFGSRKRISREAMVLLTAYPWPGNVRELGNIIERAGVLAGDEIGPDVLSPWLQGERRTGGGGENWVGVPLEEIELRLIEMNVAHFKGNRERAAEALGISSRTLRDKLKKRESKV